ALGGAPCGEHGRQTSLEPGPGWQEDLRSGCLPPASLPGSKVISQVVQQRCRGGPEPASYRERAGKAAEKRREGERGKKGLPRHCAGVARMPARPFRRDAEENRSVAAKRGGVTCCRPASCRRAPCPCP